MPALEDRGPPKMPALARQLKHCLRNTPTFYRALLLFGPLSACRNGFPEKFGNSAAFHRPCRCREGVSFGRVAHLGLACPLLACKKVERFFFFQCFWLLTWNFQKRWYLPTAADAAYFPIRLLNRRNAALDHLSRKLQLPAYKRYFLVKNPQRWSRTYQSITSWHSLIKFSRLNRFSTQSFSDFPKYWIWASSSIML